MTTPLRVAIAGTGVISHNHARAIRRLPRLSIVALVDPDAGARDRLAATIAAEGGPEPAHYASLTEALAAADLDLVVVCSPSGTHAALAEEALAAGVHVVLEKPVDAQLGAARRLAEVAEAAAARGQVCSVISQHRFDPASVAVRQSIVDGNFGRLNSAVASVAWWRPQEYYDSAPWRGTWALDGGGATMNQGVHTVDLLLWFLGRPTEVFAHTARLAHERIEVEDVAVATLVFESGALAVLHATTAAYPGLSVWIQVHGDRGSAVIHDDQLEFLSPSVHSGPPAPPGEWRGVEKPADAFVVGHWRQYVDVIEAIDHGRPPGVGVPEAVAAMAVVAGVYLSARLRRPVTLDEVFAEAWSEAGQSTD